MPHQSDSEFWRIAEITRRMKQQKVAENGDSPDDEDTDLMNFCAGVRAGKQLFVVYNGPGPYAARQCAYWTALFLSCDEVFQIADARYKTISQEEVDASGDPEGGYAAGDIGNAWAAGNREGIQECIVIQRYPLLGPPTLANYDYERQGRKIVWGKVRKEDPEMMAGAIDDHIKGAFEKRREVQPVIDEILKNMFAAMAKEDLNADEQRYWTDRGMASFVSSRSGVFLVQYLSPYPGLPDVVFQGGKEMDPASL